MASLRTASLEEIRLAAARLCRDYLNGRWKEVPADQLIVKRISGGLSNLLYYVSLPHDANGGSGGGGCDSSGASSTGKTVTCSTPEGDVNRNDPQLNDLYPTAGDCNGNKRKRHDSYSSSVMQKENEPDEVLLRIYGQSHGEDALEAMITESVVFALLSERHFGPRLHGIFPGGRLEQYIPARALQTEELAIPEISLKIAEKMGEIHTLNIPMSKEPDWAWNCMERWQRHLPAILERTDWRENEKNAQIMRGVNYTEEIAWLKAVLQSGNYPVMFCHNDLQEGNILLKPQDKIENSAEDSGLDNISMQGDDDDADLGRAHKSTEFDTSADSVISGANDSYAASTAPVLKIIDFEYCAYNYRGFDLANHFLEWTFNYSNPEFPFYHYRKDHFPTKEQRHRFIRAYLKRINDAENDWDPTQKEIDNVDHEVKLFRMLSHLFWSLWSVVNVTSNIEFGYWHYAITRINEYMELKQNYITDHTMNV